jgi:two-component system OmpR family sensor kinase
LLHQLAWLLAAITLIVGGASFGGGWWLAGRMVRPVHEITDQAEAMRPGTLGRRISAQADTREYERLVDVLNGMLARLEGAFESQRRFTADASHELRGPLTALRGEAEVALRRERDPAEYRRVLTSSLQEVERLTRLTEDLLTLARSDAGAMNPRLEITDVAARAEAVVERLIPRAEENAVRLDLVADAAAQALVDPGLVEQLIWNLVENAVKFTPAGGRVRVGVAKDGSQLVIEVRDTGAGLPAENLERIFERFYRADAARTPAGDATGTGLGLSIVRAIAEVHGGEARAHNAPGGGALIRVTLPTA